MHLCSLKLPKINKNDPLLEILIEKIKKNLKSLYEEDILVISEKVIATSQGRIVQLDTVYPISKEASRLAEEYEMNAHYVELILRESTSILGGMKNVILAEVNSFLIANAGIDQSNAGPGKVVLLPKNVKKVAWDYWNTLREEFKVKNLGIIIADSRVQPLRKGTIGVALATAGFEPIEDCRGQPDLFDRPLEITMRAVADDLTSAAQFLLGEANEQTPIVLIRGANVEFTEHPTLTTEMPPEECLYMNIFSKYLLKKQKKG
ncbi:MAG: Coenzyme F420:L-glutamate ligase [Promethearchaeota archaeon]|nr:MAG: Coenzyme F420:L-glutamate ligase [Candidatus Lokiarchaeota archaeon]